MNNQITNSLEPLYSLLQNIEHNIAKRREIIIKIKCQLLTNFFQMKYVYALNPRRISTES